MTALSATLRRLPGTWSVFPRTLTPGHVDGFEAALRLRAATFDWCERMAQRHVAGGRLEEGVMWAIAAGRLAFALGHSSFSSDRMEWLLRAVASELPAGAAPLARAATGPFRWMHVYSETYAFGGHTAFVRRWLERDSSTDEHHLIVSFQDSEDIEPRLAAEVSRRGGKIHALGRHGKSRLLDRATRLKQLCAEGADAVVLHHHPWDALPSLAFAESGGPPVLVLNHADHVFWYGNATADAVIDSRGNGGRLAAAHRQIPRTFELPIPLGRIAPADRCARLDDAWRQRLGIRPEDTVFLTVGTAQKFQPAFGLDFTLTALALLARIPNSHLIAVGPEPTEARWAQAMAQAPGRIHALGYVADLPPVHACADIYLEGFPFGSATALLEAGLSGLPVVRAPAEVPDLFKAESSALTDTEVPANVDAYIDAACALARDMATRRLAGERMHARIEVSHGPDRWWSYVARIKAGMPARHVARDPAASTLLPVDLTTFWDRFALTSDPVTRTFLDSFWLKLAPRVDAPLIAAIRQARRGGFDCLGPFAAMWLGHAVSVMPRPLAGKLINLLNRLQRHADECST